MAASEKKASGSSSAAKPGKAKKKGINLFTLILLLIPLPFIMPTVLVCFGLLPTLVAMITDDDPEKSRAVCIGSMNFAGVTPFLLELWLKGQTMEAAFQIVSQPNSWLVMFGAAAVGHLILFIVPPVVASFGQNQAESRLTKLQESLGQLKAIWGPEVATTESAEKLRLQNTGPK